MSTATIRHTATLEVTTCYKCGTPFGVESCLHRRLKERGETFYCPNGHGQVYTRSITQKLEDAEKALERERARTQRWRDESEANARSAAAYKGHLTRTKKRVAAGVCVCCNRSFRNLADHMRTQHPEYAEDGGNE